MKRKVISVILASAMIMGVASCDKLPMASETSSTDEPVETTEAPVETTLDPNSIMGFNMINNGDFTSGDFTWITYFETGDGVLSVNDKGEMQFDVKVIGTKDYANQISYDGFALYKNCKYEMQFDCYSTIERDLEYRIQLNGGDYHAYNIDVIHVTPEVQHFDFVFMMEEDSDPAPRLCFNMGLFDGLKDAGPHSVMFDNVDLRCIDDSGYDPNSTGVSSDARNINLNQIGYLTNASKTAVLSGDAIAAKAHVVDVASGETVYEGDVGAASVNASTGREEAIFDFSSVTAAGTYKVVVGEHESFEFAIGDDVYDEAFKASLRMFYMQRCGCELTEDLAGEYAHAVCHTGEAKIYGTDTTIDVSGGWHDAGDYGRYVVSGAKAAADLMLAYSLYPSAFDDALDIPESGNGVPDVLDEVRFELDWLFKMQAADGGVYHKVTCANFPSTVMPEEETEELIVCPVSTTATGDFAAVMAMASYVYADVDSEFAAKCLDAAVKAAEYLDAHADLEGAVNPSDIVTGEYPDTNDADERVWAYAELFKATGDSKYDEAFCNLISAGVPCATDLGWQGVGAYAGYAYLSAEKAKGKFYDAVVVGFMGGIPKIEAAAAGDAYGSSLTEYPWGSNMTVANNGMYILLYNDIKGGTEDVSVATTQLNYLLGTNGTGYCFLSGFGSLSPENPHHRPSQAQGEAVPGMLAGGPNQNIEDPYAQNVFTDIAPNAPALCYADNDQAYSLNEVAIYWNSPVVFLFAYVESLG
ncbi:MAG: glycoside hydrolase family 9 protein [Saccharofermentans sp.]|nr:glycoside hydrolase family 9 protein [Saccharofermentans sp.]